MKPTTPYLFFGGNCREAITFYQECFGGDLEITTYAEMPADEHAAARETGCMPEQGAEEKIMHGQLTNGTFVLMASDHPASEPVTGDYCALSIDCDSPAEVDRLFAALSDGGTAVMPAGEAFWGAYFGMVVDKYGFQWMLSCPLEK